ncbi:MAG: hypothetical protein D6160_11010 [Ketobacter sp.]|nr:MAG: hypothetical protein D6160_11010 [Ketobacter sp.]
MDASVRAFGNPDGSKGTFQERISEFVRLDERKFPNGISAPESSRSVRIIVGKKGAGKTLYLRRLQDSTRQDESVFSAELTEDIPGTDAIVGFCQQFKNHNVDEAWEKAWRLAIIRSCISYLITKKYFLKDYNIERLASQISPYFGEILPKYDVERTVYAELNDIIFKFRSESHFMKYFNHPAWDDIQRYLASALKTCPPIFFYLDGMDEDFKQAPMEWLKCQKGLFTAVMRFARKHNALSARLHIVIAVRDTVYLSILENSEHRERYRNAPEISILDWDYEAIRIFFLEKILQVPPEIGRYTDIANFASLSEITPPTRQGGSERIERYLIRHTRLLPRDIVQLGNEIVEKRLKNPNNMPENWLDQFTQIVHKNSKSFAIEQLTICANQLASHDVPLYAAKHGYSDWYVSQGAYADSRQKPIQDFIGYVGRESFTEGDLVEASGFIKNEIAEGVNMGTILWQNGLLGVKRRDSDPDFEFCNLSEGVGFSIPQGCRLYAFHPILIHALDLEINLNVAPGAVDV